LTEDESSIGTSVHALSPSKQQQDGESSRNAFYRIIADKIQQLIDFMIQDSRLRRWSDDRRDLRAEIWSITNEKDELRDRIWDIERKLVIGKNKEESSTQMTDAVTNLWKEQLGKLRARVVKCDEKLVATQKELEEVIQKDTYCREEIVPTFGRRRRSRQAPRGSGPQSAVVIPAMDKKVKDPYIYIFFEKI
jgi:hypothetical protein